jgi:hypothetical protein
MDSMDSKENHVQLVGGVRHEVNSSNATHSSRFKAFATPCRWVRERKRRRMIVPKSQFGLLSILSKSNRATGNFCSTSNVTTHSLPVWFMVDMSAGISRGPEASTLSRQRLGIERLIVWIRFSIVHTIDRQTVRVRRGFDRLFLRSRPNPLRARYCPGLPQGHRRCREPKNCFGLGEFVSR